MKAKLFDTTATALTSIAEVGAELGLPNDEATIYSKVVEINNPESGDFGKFTFPVYTAGRWKCDQLFESSDLVDWNDDWFIPEEPTE